MIPTAEPDDPVITQEQRQSMFKMAQSAFGADGNDLLKRLLREENYESTHDLPTSVYNRIVKRVFELAEQKKADEAEDAAMDQPEDGETADTGANAEK